MYNYMKKSAEVASAIVGTEVSIKEEKGFNNSIRFSLIMDGMDVMPSFKEADVPVGIVSEERFGSYIAERIREVQEAEGCPLVRGDDVKNIIISNLKKGDFIPFLFNPSLNKEWMEKKGVVEWELIPDHLSVGLRIKIKEDGAGLASIVLDPGILKEAGMSKDDLDIKAILDSQQIVSYNLTDYLNDSGKMPYQMERLPLSIIGRENFGEYGASGIFKPGILSSVAAEYGLGEMYVIPSSVHECITMPIEMPIELAKDMVHCVNSTELRPEEVLSGDVFIYNAELDSIKVADEESDDDSFTYYL